MLKCVDLKKENIVKINHNFYIRRLIKMISIFQKKQKIHFNIITEAVNNFEDEKEKKLNQ